jgi:hypothetical protein
MFNRDWNNSFFLFSFFSFLQNIAVNNFKQYKVLFMSIFFIVLLDSLYCLKLFTAIFCKKEKKEKRKKELFQSLLNI